MQLLDQVIVEEVLACIRSDKLAAFQERLAIELGRIESISDPEMVILAREMIGRALHHIADHGWGAHDDEQDIRIRYLNQICREVEADRPP